MKINLSNKEIKIIVANDFKTRLIGLMNKTNINYGILFPKCNSIHTFFMKEEIDILGLNELNEIIYLKHNLSKNKIIKIPNKNKKTSILELPKNTSKNLKIGDKLFFEFEDVV